MEIVVLIGWVISLIIFYYVIKGAVRVALREARREDRIEQDSPENAKWLPSETREYLAKRKERRATP